MNDWRTMLDAHESELPGGSSTHIWRDAALTAFEDAGTPRPRAAPWKHTPLKALTKGDFGVHPGSESTYSGGVPHIEGAIHLILVGGVLDLEHSETLPDGVHLTALDAHIAKTGDNVLPADMPHTVNAPFDQLNAAFVGGGSLITVDAGVDVETPIVLVHVGGSEGDARHVQHHIELGAGSRATIVELWACSAGLHNTMTRTAVGDNAELHHVLVQENGPTTVFLADQRHVLGRDARLFGSSIALGSTWARVGIHARLAGEGALCDLSGVYLGADQQHHDHTIRMEHKGPHGTSKQRYRGILNDRSRGVFSSLLVVTDTGVKADGLQDNRNVLLSEHAHANSEPMLEIYTDDVKAAHGAAIGTLDESALFYMRSRGINVSTARRMLTAGIAREVIADIRAESVRDVVMERVESWLESAVS